jgi:hypothetical protein
LPNAALPFSNGTPVMMPAWDSRSPATDKDTSRLGRQGVVVSTSPGHVAEPEYPWRADEVVGLPAILWQSDRVLRTMRFSVGALSAALALLNCWTFPPAGSVLAEGWN